MNDDVPPPSSLTDRVPVYMARSTSKLVVLAVSLLILLLAPSTAVARVGPTLNKAIHATVTQYIELPELVIGPESVAFDKHGAGPYVSMSDGQILKYGGEGLGWTTFAYSPSYVRNNRSMRASELPTIGTESSCGHPLGLQFHLNSGYLYIADAYMGLMRVGLNGGEATVLATEAAGVPLSFTNRVVVDQTTGDVYFMSSSTTYTRAQHEMATQSGDLTGRVLKYDPRTNEVTVLLSDVTYPNGISISAVRTHLVVALTSPCKLLKYWLRGPKAGRSIPIMCVQIKRGGYWVALHWEKYELLFGKDSHLLAVRISSKGEKLQDMRGHKSVRPIEIVERDSGKIYLGSVELSYVSIVST